MHQRRIEKGFALSLSVIACIGLLMTVFSIGLYAGHSVVNDYRSNAMKQEAESFDHALAQYAATHKTMVNPSDAYDAAKKEMKRDYGMQGTYPASLTELGAVKILHVQDVPGIQDEAYEYVNGALQRVNIANTVTTSSGTHTYFEYQPISESGEPPYTSYNLLVHLPNGYIYYTSGSSRHQGEQVNQAD